MAEVPKIQAAQGEPSDQAVGCRSELVAQFIDQLSHQLESVREPSIELAQQWVDDWIQHVGVRYFSELTNLAQLTEEVGELARIMSRRYGEQSFKPGDKGQTDQELADELADIFFVLICICNQTGVDLTRALKHNLQKKCKRDSERHLQNRKLSTRD